MTGQNKSKNLTFVEVLIVVLVCLFLLAVGVPAFQIPRSDAMRMTCLKNLSLIGKAMLIYSNDYDDEFPRAGGRNSVWGSRIPNWRADNRFTAYGLSANGSGGQATISSSLYFLVKYTEVMPKFFVCPGDVGTTEFKPVDYDAGDRELINLWDFGPEATKHCSYAYHMPYGLYRLTTSSEPGMAVAADRNPWIDSPAAEAKDGSLIYKFNPDGGREAVKIGNSITHKEEGQNVLFVDGHVSFEDRPSCGVENDNIYTFWDGGDFRVGGVPFPGIEPMGRSDSLLVHDPPGYKTITTKQPKSINSKDLKQTSVVATLYCTMPERQNVIWCSTFQMAWDKLKNDIIGEPVKVLGAEELAARLNQGEVSTGDIEEESFYSTAGIVKKGIIEEIQKEMKKRFPSEPVPVFEELDTLPPAFKYETIVTYSYLEVDVGFKYPFHNTDDAFTFQDSKGKRIGVTAFCTDKEGWDSALREQVEILYYKQGEKLNAAEFVVDLCKHTQPYQVILALVPRCDTLGEAVATIEQKISEFKHNPNYEVLRKLRPARGVFQPADRLIVPDVLYKLTHHFEELKGKLIKNQEFLDYWFLVAEQMIDFALSRTGVTLKSQARLSPPPPAGRLPEPRRLYFNRPFLVYVKKRQGSSNPFFVMWVDNAELMKEF